MPKWDEAEGIPGAGMRGRGGPSTGAGMASGAPEPGPGYDQAAEAKAEGFLRSVRQQLANAPGGIGATYGRDEHEADYDDESY